MKLLGVNRKNIVWQKSYERCARQLGKVPWLGCVSSGLYRPIDVKDSLAFVPRQHLFGGCCEHTTLFSSQLLESSHLQYSRCFHCQLVVAHLQNNMLGNAPNKRLLQQARRVATSQVLSSSFKTGEAEWKSSTCCCRFQQLAVSGHPSNDQKRLFTGSLCSFLADGKGRYSLEKA